MAIVPQVELGSLGMADSLILMVMALVVFGPRRLPQIGRQIGKLMYEFRKASNDFKFQMEEELRLSEEADRRRKEEEQRKQLPQESVSADPAPVNAIESQSGTAAPAAGVSIETPAENVPRIQPPSTGETVAVVRRAPAASEVLDPMGQVEQPAGSGAPQQDNAAATEAVNHNG
ncbi:MAG TPA: twin-arginine translocase TatA/TatE family subunit [Terracidiphilus sp.]|nr:twin-arginine translocase TatA/TatE family subunit [Terracidiphilus sp.]